MARVQIIFPDGGWGTIEEAEVQSALAQGYRIPSAKDVAGKKAYDAPVLATALGAARIVTGGGSDYVLGELSGRGPAVLQNIREENPTANLIGEVGGALAPVGVAKRIAGLADDAGKQAARAFKPGLGAKVVEKTTAGAVEGFAFGTQQALSDSYLTDQELTAERFLSSVGPATLLGGGLGGLLGAAGHGIGKARSMFGVADEAAEAAGATGRATRQTTPGGPSVTPELTDGNLGRVAEKYLPRVKKIFDDLGIAFPSPENAALRDLDVKKKAAERLNKKGMIESAPRRLLEDERYAAARLPEEKIALLQKKTKENGNILSDRLAAFDSIVQPGERVNYPNIAERIRTEVIAPLRKGTSLNKPIIERLEKEVADLEFRPDTTFKAAEDLKRSYDPYLGFENVADPPPMKEALRSVRRMIKEEVETRLEALGKKYGDDGKRLYDEWKDAKQGYGEMKELLIEAESRLVAAKTANRVFSLTDNIWGGASAAAGIFTGGFGGLALAGVGMLLNKWGRERLPHIVAIALHGARKNKGIMGAFARASKDVADAPVGSLGKWEVQLRDAAKRGPEDLGATHAALMQADDAYAETANRVPGLGGISDAFATNGASHDGWQRIQDSMDAVFSGVRRATIAGTRSPLEQPLFPAMGKAAATDRRGMAAQRAEEIRKLAGNPEALAELIGEAIGQLPPAIAQGVSQRISRAVGFLASVAPKAPSSGGTMPALARPHRPSDSEVGKFERYLRAVNDPLSVLDDLAQGRVTREAVEALQAVYPRLHGEVKTAIAERLGDKDAKVPYSAKLSLAVLFGAPVEPALEPSLFQVLQTVPQSPDGPGPSGMPNGRPQRPNSGYAAPSESLGMRKWSNDPT